MESPSGLNRSSGGRRPTRIGYTTPTDPWLVDSPNPATGVPVAVMLQRGLLVSHTFREMYKIGRFRSSYATPFDRYLLHCLLKRTEIRSDVGLKLHSDSRPLINPSFCSIKKGARIDAISPTYQKVGYSPLPPRGKTAAVLDRAPRLVPRIFHCLAVGWSFVWLLP